MHAEMQCRLDEVEDEHHFLFDYPACSHVISKHMHVFEQVRTVPEYRYLHVSQMLVVDFSGTILSVGSVFRLTDLIEVTELTYVCRPPGSVCKQNTDCIND